MLVRYPTLEHSTMKFSRHFEILLVLLASDELTDLLLARKMLASFSYMMMTASWAPSNAPK